MMQKIAILFVAINLTGCGDVRTNYVYEHPETGIQIVVGDGWAEVPLKTNIEISSNNIAYDLKLKYFDPETGDLRGALSLFKLDGIKSVDELIEDEDCFNNVIKIVLKEQPCLYRETETDQNLRNEVYTVVKNDTALTFILTYPRSFADQVTNILNKIYFQPVK